MKLLLFFFSTPFYHRITVRGCPHLPRQKMVLCSHLEYLICNYRCTWLLHLTLSDTILKLELSSENKAVDCPRTHDGSLCLQGPIDLVLGRWHYARMLAWVLEVWMCSHSVSSKYRTRAPCPGTRCEPCLRFLMCSCCSFSGLWIYVHCNLIQEKGSSLWGHLALITLSSIWI